MSDSPDPGRRVHLQPFASEDWSVESGRGPAKVKEHPASGVGPGAVLPEFAGLGVVGVGDAMGVPPGATFDTTDRSFVGGTGDWFARAVSTLPPHPSASAREMLMAVHRGATF